VISSVRNFMEGNKGQTIDITCTHTYLQIYTYIHIAFISRNMHIKTWRSFKVMYERCWKKQQQIHIKITTTSGEMMNEARRDLFVVIFVIVAGIARWAKCRKPEKGLDSTRLESSWLKSNLIKCIAGILHKKKIQIS